MEHYLFLVQPFIAAFTGWLVISITLWMLFNPQKPVKFMGLTIQGIIPKRQRQVAMQAGKMAAQLVPFDKIADQLKDTEQLKALNPVIETHLDHFLEVKLKEKMPVISMFVGSGTIGKIKDGMMEEIETLLPELIHRYTDSLKHKIDIEKTVAEKLSDFSTETLESSLQSVMKKEFMAIKLMGAGIGFLIGLLQMVISMI